MSDDRLAPATIVLVDDHALIRAGFKLILEATPDLRVIGEAENGRQGVEVVRRLRPDLVLLDIQMPVLDGLGALALMMDGPQPSVDDESSRPPLVIMLTTFERDEYIFQALRLGASGFMLKNDPPEDFIQGVRAVLRGGALLAPAVTRRLIEDFAQQRDDSGLRDLAERLTDREKDVLSLLAKGLSNSEIAEAFVLSEETIRTHVAHILGKLELRDRAQAVVFAYESGAVRAGH